MKKIILCAMLIMSSGAFADHVAPGIPAVAAPDLVVTTGANPDRRRVAGSALILKADGVIDEVSIPSNTISKPEVVAPKNKIIDGTATIIENPKKD